MSQVPLLLQNQGSNGSPRALRNSRRMPTFHDMSHFLDATFPLELPAILERNPLVTASQFRECGLPLDLSPRSLADDLSKASAQGLAIACEKILDLAYLQGYAPLPEYFTASVHAAAKKGHVHVLQTMWHHLAKAQLDFNGQCNVDRSTPLIVAARHGHRDVVEFLCQVVHVDIHLRNIFECNAWHVAMCHKRHDIAEYLEGRGADRSVCTYRGCNIFHTLAAVGDVDKAVEFLSDPSHQQNLPSLTEPNLFGRLPVSLAAVNRNFAMFRLLVEHGGWPQHDKNNNHRHRDYNGCSISHSCLVGGDLRIIRYAMEYNGLDINDVDKKGRDGLAKVCMYQHADVVKWIFENGIFDFDRAVARGKSMQDYIVAVNGNKDIIYLLIHHLVVWNGWRNVPGGSSSKLRKLYEVGDPFYASVDRQHVYAAASANKDFSINTFLVCNKIKLELVEFVDSLVVH